MPIEPLKQTKLLDELMRVVPDVIYASVPGAGGDDAIFALALKKGNATSLADKIKTKFLKSHP